MDESKYKLYSKTSDAWHGMYQGLLGAQQSIYWELYIFLDDEIGVKFFDVLERKSREGVDVKLIVDSMGSFWISRGRIKSLRNAGVDLVFFSERKKRYRGVWKKLWSRSHRKILVIDEELGFIGGVNIHKRMAEWPDIQVRIEGKAVHSLLRSFAKSYIISGGNKKQVRHLLKYKFRVAEEIEDLQFVYDDADVKRSRVRKVYTEALLKARERVILFSPYYFPDKKFIRALWKARKRGVRVDLLIPFRSDIRVATHAAFAIFGIMRGLGVNIHRTREMMHGKGVVVDDDWALIGSSNIDHVSFYDNYEANVKISDKAFVKKLKQTVLGWLDRAEPLNENDLKKRGKFERMKDAIAFYLQRLWHRSGM